jgi:hypothetical protein
VNLAAALVARMPKGARLRPRPSPIALGMGRDDLPALCRAYGLAQGAEIGVWKGAYSERFCQAGIRMLCVDPWESYPAWKDTKNALSGDEAIAFMEAARLQAVDRLSRYPGCQIVRAYSVPASRLVPNGSLDFVYLDGNHSYMAVIDDLLAWVPKVRAGGLIAGHDYRINPRKPFIQVVDAIRDFTGTRSITPWYVTARDRTPSFLWVQP